MKTEFDYIDENYKRIVFNINEAKQKYKRSDESIEIIAVTKTIAPESVNHAISLCGIKILGENKVQEYISKKDFYKPASVHFIGQLQTNKVKYIIDTVDLIQSVDNIRLAAEIDKHAGRIGKIQDILIEVNIAGEELKGGIKPDELSELLYQAAELKNIKGKGLMSVPPILDSEKVLY